jgi:hypothetical protein
LPLALRRQRPRGAPDRRNRLAEGSGIRTDQSGHEHRCPRWLITHEAATTAATSQPRAVASTERHSSARWWIPPRPRTVNVTRARLPDGRWVLLSRWQEGSACDATAVIRVARASRSASKPWACSHSSSLSVGCMNMSHALRLRRPVRPTPAWRQPVRPNLGNLWRQPTAPNGVRKCCVGGPLASAQEPCGMPPVGRARRLSRGDGGDPRRNRTAARGVALQQDRSPAFP